MGDCCDRSAAVEAGVLKPRAVRLMKKAHLKMDVIHPSPLVINVKKNNNNYPPASSSYYTQANYLCNHTSAQLMN